MPKRVSRSRAAAPGKRRSPVKFSKAIRTEVCERLAAGERWYNIAGTGRLPTLTVPYKWAKLDPEFGAAWRLARQVGADSRADKVLDIAEATTTESLSVDRFHVGSLKWHVDRESKMYGDREDEPDLGFGRKLIIEVRQFERVVRDDGTAYVQEILPSGEIIDL